MTELKPKFAAMGLVLRGVDMGKVDLPPDYRAGMEKLLSEELETEKVHYTLELKEADVKQKQLEAEADKVRRQTAAEAAGEEQVIAARAQEETMKHILPFKEKQIEQRNSRRKPTRWRVSVPRKAPPRRAASRPRARPIRVKSSPMPRPTGSISSAKPMPGRWSAREHWSRVIPLLIQKTLADKLSDKVQVIIAPLPAAGHFLGSNLIGTQGLTSPEETAAEPSTAAQGSR